MSIPGFTATCFFPKAISGFKSAKAQRASESGTSRHDRHQRRVYQSRRAGDPECSFLCQTSGDIGGGGGTGGGGITPHCNVGCGPCQQIGGRRQRACVQANCNVHSVAC